MTCHKFPKKMENPWCALLGAFLRNSIDEMILHTTSKSKAFRGCDFACILQGQSILKGSLPHANECD